MLLAKRTDETTKAKCLKRAAEETHFAKAKGYVIGHEGFLDVLEESGKKRGVSRRRCG